MAHVQLCAAAGANACIGAPPSNGAAATGTASQGKDVTREAAVALALVVLLVVALADGCRQVLRFDTRRRRGQRGDPAGGATPQTQQQAAAGRGERASDEVRDPTGVLVGGFAGHSAAMEISDDASVELLSATSPRSCALPISD